MRARRGYSGIVVRFRHNRLLAHRMDMVRGGRDYREAAIDYWEEIS